LRRPPEKTIPPPSPKGHAPVAQLDRASDYESEGRTFESFRARHFPNKNRYLEPGLYSAPHETSFYYGFWDRVFADPPVLARYKTHRFDQEPWPARQLGRGGGGDLRPLWPDRIRAVTGPDYPSRHRYGSRPVQPANEDWNAPSLTLFAIGRFDPGSRWRWPWPGDGDHHESGTHVRRQRTCARRIARC
jgi:hypothetical protein